MRANHTQPLTYDDINVGVEFESLAGRSNAGGLRAFGAIVRAWFDRSRQRRAFDPPATAQGAGSPRSPQQGPFAPMGVG
jgi:hypothetical protein